MRLRAVVLASASLSIFSAASALYGKNSPVLQVDAKSYDRLVAQSNYSTACLLHASLLIHLLC